MVAVVFWSVVLAWQQSYCVVGCSRVRRVLRASGSVPRQNVGHSSCMPILVRTVHTCADRGDLTGTVLGVVLDAHNCATTGALLGVAQCLVRRWIHVMHHSGWLLEEFMIFYMRMLTGLLSSIHVLLFSSVAGTLSTTAVACSILVLLVWTHFALCSHDCWLFSRKYTVDASVAHDMHLEICTLFLRASCIFQHLQRSNFLRESIFWSPRALTLVSARGLVRYQSRRESRLPGDSVPVLHKDCTDDEAPGDCAPQQRRWPHGQEQVRSKATLSQSCHFAVFVNPVARVSRPFLHFL